MLDFVATPAFQSHLFPIVATGITLAMISSIQSLLSMASADELCDRVAFVVDGRIVAMDTPAELKIARSRRSVRVEFRGDDGLLDSADFGLDGLADDPDFHSILRHRNVETIHSREASLDDVFVEVTGRRLL